MKKNENKIRWDPITARLAESSMKENTYIPATKQHAPPPNQTEQPETTKERRSKEEFEEYLKSLFADDNLPFKYQNPDAWILYKTKKRRKTWYL